MRNFENWTLPKTLVSLLKLGRRVKMLEILEYFQSHNIYLTEK